MAVTKDIIVGIDAGTSVVKAVAFDLHGEQIACSSARNNYQTDKNGAATQSMTQTWNDCVEAITKLHDRVENFASRIAAIGLTGQGDGTWLVGKGNQPVGDAWIWLDARAAPTVSELLNSPHERARFEATGTGLNTCQQGTQMAHMKRHYPELLANAEVALHCKDWLFLNLTDIRATDPSEASFTFGDFRNRAYSDVVFDALGLKNQRHLLPEIIDGTQQVFPLSKKAAEATGLIAGTPVSLGYVDMVMTALGSGVHTGEDGVGCSTIGSTGVHMKSVHSKDVYLNAEGTGYVICLPIPDQVTQVQTNMAAALNIDWAISLASDLMADMGKATTHADLVNHVEGWLASSNPGALLYHPYISEAGERGPFVNANARASFVGLNSSHRFADLMRGVVEGMSMAARDCYSEIGKLPTELRITGGAARSQSLRQILSASMNTPVRNSARDEAGAAGCAMMAAVAIGVYPDMGACIDEWVKPLLGEAELPDQSLVPIYEDLFQAYQTTSKALTPVWEQMAEKRQK